MIFESHAHYDDEQFLQDREELFRLFSDSPPSIGCIINVGSDFAGCHGSLELAKAYDFIYAALGLHPSYVSELNEESFSWLSQTARREKFQRENPQKEALRMGKVVAIGEIGLDYHWEKEELGRKNQQEWLVRQLDLAREAKLPIIIHSRDAAEDTLKFLQDHGQGLEGTIHCFSYGWEMAEKFLDLGFHLGITGVVTYKKAPEVKEVVKNMPLDRMLIETDSPYLAPVPFRGKRNSSLYLPYIVEAIATIRGISIEEVEEATYQNAERLFLSQR